MLSLESSSRIAASIEQTILRWLQFYRFTDKVIKLEQLSDGKIFLKILQQLPYFKLSHPLIDQTYQEFQFQSKLKRIKIIYQSLKSYYQTVLMKDCSNIFIIDVIELCSGNKKQIIKLIELIVGAFVSSTKKNDFLVKIMEMEIEHQQVFMLLIKNSMNIGQDIEKSSVSNSPNKIRSLLNRIEELQEENNSISKNLEEVSRQMEESRSINAQLIKQVNDLKQDNQYLLEQNEQLRSNQKSPGKTTRNFQLMILQQRLATQKQIYDKKIWQQQQLIKNLEQNLKMPNIDIEKYEKLVNANDLLRKNVEYLKSDKAEIMQILKQKDDKLTIIADKNRIYQDRIIKLQKELEQIKFKNFDLSKTLQDHQNTLNNRRDINMISTPRERINLNEEMVSVIDDLTIQNSKLLNQMAQKQLSTQESYQNIIKSQKQRIQSLEQQINMIRNQQHTIMNLEYQNYPNQIDYHTINTNFATHIKLDHKTNFLTNITSSIQNTKANNQIKKNKEYESTQQIEVLIPTILYLIQQIKQLRQQRQNQSTRKNQRKLLYLRSLHNTFN